MNDFLLVLTLPHLFWVRRLRYEGSFDLLLDQLLQVNAFEEGMCQDLLTSTLGSQAFCFVLDE